MGAPAGLVSRLHPQASSEERGQSVERLQSRVGGLQTELEKMRRQLATEREEFHLKEAQMEASIKTAHKANQELEVNSFSLSLIFFPCLIPFLSFIL